MSDNFLNRRCPLGSRSIDWSLRHCADFSGVTGKIILPESLNQFRDFRYNEKKRRISFITANNSGCQKPNLVDVFSMDKYQIDAWNSIFIKANPYLKYETASSPGGVKFYDFVDRDSDDKNGFTFWSRTQEKIADLPDVLSDATKAAFWVLLIGGTIYLFKDPKNK